MKYNDALLQLRALAAQYSDKRYRRISKLLTDLKIEFEQEAFLHERR